MVFLDIKQPKGGAAITSLPSFFGFARGNLLLNVVDLRTRS